MQEGREEIEGMRQEKCNMEAKEEAMRKLLSEFDIVKETVSTLRGKVAEHEAR